MHKKSDGTGGLTDGIKAGDHRDPSNNRKISVILTLGKMFYRIINARLANFPNENESRHFH